MSTVRQIGIRMTVDAQSVTTELPKAGREFVQMASQAEQSGARTTRSLAQVRMAVRDVVAGAGALHVVGAGLTAISQAITALPRNAFDYSKQLEVSQVGMAGILGSMTAINGQQTTYNQGLRLSSEYIRKLNDDALRTAATSQELTTVFQALMAPGLGAKMTLEEIRQLTVVGTNAVKSMGLESTQVVQELRDLVQGGITPASSTLASALGLKDSDIAKAKASSEGLFAFLMSRLQGFQASSEAFSETLTGKLDQVKEGATRVAAEGMEPLTQASKKALDEVSKLFVTFDQAGNATLNQGLVDGIREFSDGVVAATTAGRELVGVVWENREAVKGLAVAYGALKLGGIANDARLAIASFSELTQAKRVAAAQSAANAAAEVKASAETAQAAAQREAALTMASQQRATALQGELRAKVASAQAEVALQAAQVATARTTVAAIELSRAEVTAKMQAARATMAQAEAQIAAARSAGAQSFALAALKQGTQQLAMAQAAHAALINELAVLGRQQTSVNASLTASTTAHAAATQTVKAASVELAAATAAGTTATVAATAATDKLTASKTRLSTTASLASSAASGLGAVVGALGGPFGIAIAAAGALAFKYWEVKRAAEAAEEAQFGVSRLQTRLADGGPIEERDVAKARGELERWQRIRDEMERTGKKELTETAWNGLIPSKVQLATMDEATARIAFHQGQIRLASARMAADSNTGGISVTLTAQSALQAFEKTVDGAKTASAAQLEYTNNVNAARQALENLKKTGASPEVVDGAEKKFAESEKAWATERDKKIKEMGASGVTAQGQAIDAQVATIKAGFKLQTEVTANGLAELAALREQDLVGEYDAIERRSALQMQELASKEAATRAELDAIKGKKDSAKEQATLLGELQEIAQKRATLEASAAREVLAADAQVLANLEKRAAAERTAATQSQDKLRTAKLDQAEIGKTGAALGVLRAARVEDAAKELERQAIVQDGIDLSGRASAALRDQAEAMRENFKVSGYNESARSVAEYARSIDDANQAVQFEQGLALLSQRDRDIALEQYRIAIGLKQQLAQIDANNPNDADGAARLKADATAAAMRATAAAATKVNVAETRRTVQQMDDIFRTGFANTANEGEDAFKAMGKSVVTTFKTDVADQIYRMFAQPIVLKMAASVTGGLEAIFGGGKSGGSDLVSMASNASSLYSAATGNGMIGNAVKTVGGWLGFGGAAASSLATGLTATTATTGLATGLGIKAGAAGLGLQAGGATLGGTLGSTVGGAAASTGLAGSISSAIAAVPVWGWIAAAVLAVGSALSKKPTPHSGGAVYSDPGLTAAINPNDKDPIGFSSYVDKETLAKVTNVATNAQAGLNAVLSAGTSKTPLSVLTGFADDKSTDGAWGQLIIKKLDATVEDALINWETTRTEKWAPKVFADGEEGFKQYQNAVAADSIAALKLVSDELPAWTNRMVAAANTAGENTAEVFAQLVTDISAYPETLLKTIGTSSEALASIIADGMRAGDPAATGEAFAQSIVGGIEASLVGNLSSQVTNIVTTGMVTPFVDALLTGATTSEALSAATMAQTLERVKAQATAFKELWGNADFQTALGEMRDVLAETVTAAAKASDYVPRFTGALDDAADAARRAEDATRRAADAERKRIAALHESAREIVQGQVDALAALRSQAVADAFAARGGMVGGLAVTAAEAEGVVQFRDALQGASDALAELEALGLKDELAGYAAEIGAIVQSTKELMAEQVASSRLLAGNAQGAIDALMSASTLAFKDFMNVGGREGFNAGAFNAAYSQEQAQLARDLGNQASANALRVQDVRSVMGSLSAQLYSDELVRPVYLGIRDAIVEASGTVGTYVVRDSVDAFARTMAEIQTVQMYQPSGPGLAGVYAAQRNAAVTTAGGVARGQWQTGADVVAYGQALDRLDGALNRGAVSQAEYTGAVDALTAAAGGAASMLLDRALTAEEQAERFAAQAAAAQAAQWEISRAGLASIDYYFTSVTGLAANLAAEASAAAAPIALATEAIGRMNSASAAFGDSARAAIGGMSGSDAQSLYALSLMREEGSSTRAALLVASAADIAAQVLTTADAAAMAKQLADSAAFAGVGASGVRDASLLLDGVKAHDAVAFEAAFTRMAAALDKGTINEVQYVELANTALRTLADEQAELERHTAQVVSAFDRLRDAARSTADALLIDDNASTLTGAQIAAEAQRQYADVMAHLRADPTDSQAAGEMAAASKAMPSAVQNVGTAAEYSAIFAETIRDLRVVESMQAPSFQSTTPVLKVPAFDIGADYLPYDMLALVHQGERILPAADNRQLMQLLGSGGNGSTAEVAALLREILARLEQLELSNLAGHHANEIANNKSAEALQQMVAEGLRPYEETPA